MRNSLVSLTIALAAASALATSCATADGTASFTNSPTTSPDSSADGQGVRPTDASDDSDAGALPDSRTDSAADAASGPNVGSDPDARSDAGTGADTAPADVSLIPGTGGVDAGGPDAIADAGGGDSPDAGPTDEGGGPIRVGDSCGFSYGFPAGASSRSLSRSTPTRAQLTGPADDNAARPTVATIAHAEPAPLGHATLRVWPDTPQKADLPEDLVIPIYEDETPLFERATDWEGGRRCYEFPDGAWEMTETQAYDTWVNLVESTLWYRLDQTPGHRNVIGLRGAVPGSFEWSGNVANYFNDTIVLLWRDRDGVPHVREFPVNTDTGAHDFGRDSSSSLVANRHYPYVNGWHRSYNALRINLPSYPVRDDANNNGHWDSDRNGWLDGGEGDYDRLGSAHNIHMGSIDLPLGQAPINTWSAGCQVIPGEDNWLEFIGNAWTGMNDAVDYYLVDARDIAPSFFTPCDSADGSHACPFEIRSFPFSYSGNTRLATDSVHDVYNCSDANEAGAEHVFVLNLSAPATLTVSVTTPDESTVDPDIHILAGDDADACLARAHRELTFDANIGRYVIVVDSWTDRNGVSLEGEYYLRVDAAAR